MKRVIVVVLIIVFMLALATTAFAQPNKPPPNPNGGSCNMINSWWPEDGPGEAKGVKDGERGMYNVHQGTNPHHGQQGPADNSIHPIVGDWYPNGATNMDIVTGAQCG